AFLLHEGFGTVGRAFALTTNAVHVDVVAHDMRDVDRHFFVRKGSKTDAAAAVDHTQRIIDRGGRCRAFDDIVDALAAVQLLHFGHDIGRLANVDHRVGAELLADFQTVVARACEYHRLGTERFGHSHRHQADRAWAGDADALAGHNPAKFGQRIH